jgi:hypothetical protein
VPVNEGGYDQVVSEEVRCRFVIEMGSLRQA